MTLDGGKLFNVLSNITSKQIIAARQDKTILAEIVEIENADSGKYRVEYQGNTFFAASTNLDVVYKKGEQVYVLVPQGDFSGQKLILGYASYKSTTEEDSLQNFYIDVGSNWVGKDSIYGAVDELGIGAAANLFDIDSLQGINANFTITNNSFAITSTQNTGTSRVAFTINDLIGKGNFYLSGYGERSDNLNYQYRHAVTVKYVEDGATITPVSLSFTNNQITFTDVEFAIPSTATSAYISFYIRSDNNTAGDCSGLFKDILLLPESIEQSVSVSMNSAGNAEIATLSQSCEYIKVSGEFKTNFLSQHNKGSYGLEVHLITKAEETDDVENIVTIDGVKYTKSVLTLGFPVFSGSPYNYTEYTKQTAYFRVPKGSVQGLLQIALAEKDFAIDRILATGEKVLNENNIFVRNIEISFAQKINLTDTLWYAYISTPRGTRLNANNHIVKLTPHLLYKGHDIFNPDNCEVQWFRQKADITIADVTEEDKDEHNKTWFDYGGNGWYPISKFIANKGLIAETVDDEIIYQYSIEEDGSLIINKADVPFEWQYKAVIIYRDNSEKEYSTQEFPLDPITIINTDSVYKLEVEKYIDGLLSTFLRIRDYNKDPYGDIKAADGRPYREWFGTYWLEHIDGSYEKVSNEKLFGPFNISRYMSAPIARFIVQCYDPYLIDPQNTSALMNDSNSPYYQNPSLLSTVEEVAILTFDCVNITDSELNVSWSGRDSFHYSTTGQLKTWEAERDNVIKPTLKWFSNSMSSYTLTVYGPGGRQLTNLTTSEAGANTYNYSNSMMQGMYIDQDKCIHFKVREQFDESKTDNSFKLEISLSGRPDPFVAMIPITFVKDGDQGTMGSDWIAPIYPCNFNNNTQANFIDRLDGQQSIPLIVQFHSNDVMSEWTQVGNNRLVLRPFVAKNGIKIENMDPYEGYFYKCYWDVRTPSSINNALAKDASFLRLYRVETGELAAANTQTFRQKEVGLVAQTGYPADITEPNRTTNTYPENYGAVEIRFFDNRCPVTNGGVIAENDNNTIQYKGTGASLADIQYRFVVKCQIDIFKGQYDESNKTIHTSGENLKVASITSFYPVDMIFTENIDNIPTNINQKLSLNWPRYVEYNSSGYDPLTSVDSNGLSLIVDNKKYLAENLTPLIQEIENRINDDGSITQIYKPSTHLNMTEGFCGAIRTTPGGGFFKNNDQTSFFVRNQIMYLNSYSNVDINGWDGQSIETDEDNGSIFAATFGAGFKEPNTNLFTGVVMGMDKSQRREAYKGDGGYDADYIKSHPYMTGIFGFQNGVSSFGLMENGTGFFGRPDRGGRIIFDGCNATMYGGANGMMTSPTLGDDMWNTMRLSFVDLTHSNTAISVKGANGETIEQGFDGKYFTDSNLSNHTNYTSLPRWYRKMWERAYIKPDGEMPYWYVKNGNVIKYDDLLAYDGTQVEGNRKIDYYNGTSVLKTISEEELNANEAALRYAREQYEIDPKGLYKADIKEGNVVIEAAPKLDEFYYDSAHEQPIISYQGRAKSAVYTDLLEKVSQTNQLTGFGAARASTTPAIEVGQHIEGLMPGIFDWDDYESIFKELRIPGNRNFMVTYDGTMWAMNGIFMGSIIGSNIIGGRIQGAEIGIGTQNANVNIYTINQDSIVTASYASLLPPTEERLWSSRTLLEAKGGGRNLGFYVSATGEVIANNIAIYGGKIDVGHFHILGSEQTNTKERGHLIQAATSDFIGETHCYGGLTVSPMEGSTSTSTNYGNFFQTNGIVAMGIRKDQHSTMVNKFWNRDSISSGTDEFAKGCFFGLDTANSESDKMRGHFWPLSFISTKSNGQTLVYVTTMNAFQNSNANYFRIGPWGTEGIQHFVRTTFQSEDYCEEPSSVNTLGYIGNVGGSIGIYGWNSRTIILTVGGSKIKISNGSITFTNNGVTYALEDLARSSGNSGSTTIIQEEEEDVNTEPTTSSGSSTSYSKKSFKAIGINTSTAVEGGIETGTDGLQYKWQYLHGNTYLNLTVYDPQDNAYHDTGLYILKPKS